MMSGVASTQELDVLIAGGGPAGLAAGIVLASCGIQTLICEKGRLPMDKACGEGIMPTGVGELDRLGVRGHIGSDDYRPILGVRYVLKDGKSIKASFKEGVGMGISRLSLSQGLMTKAQEFKSCLKINEGERVEAVGREDMRIVVRTTSATYHPTLLILATGTKSTTLDKQDPVTLPRRNMRWGAKQHYRLNPWSNAVEVYWGEGMEAYVTPLQEELVCIAYLWDRSLHPSIPGGKKLISSLEDNFPDLRNRLQVSDPIGPPISTGPMERRIHKTIGEGYLRMGDAAGYLDALTGEGISLALSQAAALQSTVVPHIEMRRTTGMSLTETDLQAFARTHKRIIRPYLQVTEIALWLNQHSEEANRLFWVLRKNPEYFQQVLSANMGKAPLWPGFMRSLKLLVSLMNIQRSRVTMSSGDRVT
jgi:menaquinone-9 beta-reductase